MSECEAVDRGKKSIYLASQDLNRYGPVCSFSSVVESPDSVFDFADDLNGKAKIGPND